MASNEECSSEDELDNGYLFRNDIISFYIKFKGKKHYFEFPILLDRSFVLREIKARTKVNGTFCLQWKKKELKTQQNKDTKPLTSSKGMESAIENENISEIYIHSTNLTTLSLKRFCGQTFYIVPQGGNGSYHCGDPGWYQFSQNPIKEKQKFIEEKFRPIDCPP